LLSLPGFLLSGTEVWRCSREFQAAEKCSVDVRHPV
jgi:hypothetical protein